jgi:hypothetical protein
MSVNPNRFQSCLNRRAFQNADRVSRSGLKMVESEFYNFYTPKSHSGQPLLKIRLTHQKMGAI